MRPTLSKSSLRIRTQHSGAKVTRQGKLYCPWSVSPPPRCLFGNRTKVAGCHRRPRCGRWVHRSTSSESSCRNSIGRARLRAAAATRAQIQHRCSGQGWRRIHPEVRLDAMVCSRCKPDILGILQKRTALRQVGLDVGCSVIGRTAIDDIQSMVRVCLALQRGKKILQDAATVVSNRDNTNLHMPCAVPLEYAPQTKPSTERETVTVLPGCKR